MAGGTGHWDGKYGTKSGLATTVPYENHQEHVYNGPSQHHNDAHNSSASLGECSANELSQEADDYLKLLRPIGNRGGRQP